MADWHKIAEERIREAVANGEFENLPGAGRPLNLDDYFSAPEETRAGYSLLKNANVLPEALALRQELESVRNQYEAASAGERLTLMNRISELETKLNLATEMLRKQR